MPGKMGDWLSKEQDLIKSIGMSHVNMWYGSTALTVVKTCQQIPLSNILFSPILFSSISSQLCNFLDLNEVVGSSVAEEFQKSYGAERVNFIKCDVSSKEQLEGMYIGSTIDVVFKGEIKSKSE